MRSFESIKDIIDVPGTPESSGGREASSGEVGGGGNFFIEVLKVVVIALIIILPVRYFLIQPFYVRGASMEPNFHDYEYLIIDEISYRFHEPRRGDVVVLKDPRNTSQYFVKRIIGLPGEEVKIQGGVIHIFNDAYPKGFLLNESPYLAPEITTSGTSLTELDVGQYFVLGDNRSASLDSRSIGAVPGENMVGRVWLRAWPFRRVAHFESPEYLLPQL